MSTRDTNTAGSSSPMSTRAREMSAAIRHVHSGPIEGASRLPARSLDSHKGTFGTVAVLGGSAGDLLDAHGGRGPVMLGAPALSALGALRAGAGLVKIGAPAPVLQAALTLCPSATGLAISTDADGWYEPHVAAGFVDRVLASCDVLAIGPGLGTSPGACAAVLRAMQQDHVPIILDADGLNCLSSIPEFLRDFRAPAVLTPHPGEFKRLVGAIGLKGDLGLSESRERAAEQLAQRLGRIVVLKGHQTVVTDGQRTWVCPAHLGHPCLATAGTGDVLTGLIASLAAQFVAPAVHPAVARLAPQMSANAGKPLDLFGAAVAGVTAHALAGSVWAMLNGCEGGLMATDLVELLPACVQHLREPRG